MQEVNEQHHHFQMQSFVSKLSKKEIPSPPRDGTLITTTFPDEVPVQIKPLSVAVIPLLK